MSATPVAKETRVRVEVLSKMTATVLRPAPDPAKVLHAVRCAFFSATARSRTSACSAGVRSVSMRKCAGHDAAPSVTGRRWPSEMRAGSAARNWSACSSVRMSGGASRMVAGRGAVDDEPGVQGQPDHLRRATSGVQIEADQQAVAAHLGHAGDAGQAAGQPVPHAAHVLQHVLAFDHVQRGQGGRGRHRVPAERGPVLAGGQQRRRRLAEGDQCADREAAAQALGQRDGVRQVVLGTIRGGSATPANHLPVRPMPVWTSSRISSAPAARGQLRGLPSGIPRSAAGRRPRPGSVPG